MLHSRPLLVIYFMYLSFYFFPPEFNLGICLPTLAVDQNHLECPLTLQLPCSNPTPLTTHFEALDVGCIWKTCIYFKLPRKLSHAWQGLDPLLPENAEMQALS